MKSDWSGDAFQTPLLVQNLCRLSAVDRNDNKFVDAVKLVIQQRSRLSMHRSQPQSAYLRYKNVLALLSLVESEGMMPDELASAEEVGYALERAGLVSFDELCRQISFHASGDSANFDVVVLAFSFLAYWETSSSAFLSSWSKGIVNTANSKLIEQALEIIFASQNPDGTWRKGEPIFSKRDDNG